MQHAHYGADKEQRIQPGQQYVLKEIRKGNVQEAALIIYRCNLWVVAISINNGWNSNVRSIERGHDMEFKYTNTGPMSRFSTS